MKLKEVNPFSYNILESDASKLREGVIMKIGGVFQRADTENANRRVYPRQLWTNVLQRPDVVERIEGRRMFGMLGHPASGQTDPEKVSHVITKQELRTDNTVYGEAEVLDTPTGQIAAALFKAGTGLGISSRGDGSIEKKGDKNEVQEDYRLKTYDLVLDPSTPGARPGVIAEDQVENEKLVAEAIEGLVKSESIAEDQRMPILTECLKILSVLEAKNSGGLVESLSEKITEELKVHEPETIVAVESKETPSEPGFESNPLQEDTMPYPNQGSNPSAPSMSQDTLAWHQNQVQQSVTQALYPKDQEIAGLKDTLIKVQREHTETKKRLKAAESLIEEFTAKIKEMEESAPSDLVLQERYSAAVELLDEALKRLPELGQLSRRNETLEGLLQASIDHVQESKLAEAISECLAKVDKSYHDTVRPVLEGCSTVEDVAKTFKAFVTVGSGSPTTSAPTEPLPPTNVNESRTSQPANPPTPQKTEESFVGLLSSRLSRAV